MTRCPWGWCQVVVGTSRMRAIRQRAAAWNGSRVTKMRKAGDEEA